MVKISHLLGIYFKGFDCHGVLSQTQRRAMNICLANGLRKP